MTKPDVLIVSYRSPDELKVCLDSVRQCAPGSRVLVWDNFSTRSEDVRHVSLEYPDVQWTFSATNVGFGAAMNILARKVSSEYFLLLNPDARLVAPVQTLEATLIGNPGLAATAPWFDRASPEKWDVAHRPYSLIRTLVSHAGYSAKLRWSFFSDLYPNSPTKSVGYLTGACLMVRTSAWVEVGEFDEQFFLYSEEVDWAARARDKGWQILLTQAVGVSHKSQGTVLDSATETTASDVHLRNSQKLYIRKYSGWLAAMTFVAALFFMDRFQPSKIRKSRNAGK